MRRRRRRPRALVADGGRYPASSLSTGVLAGKVASEQATPDEIFEKVKDAGLDDVLWEIKLTCNVCDQRHLAGRHHSGSVYRRGISFQHHDGPVGKRP
jgi:hypothetical protein